MIIRGTGGSGRSRPAANTQPKSLAWLQGLDVGLGRARCHRRGGLDARAYRSLPLNYVGPFLRRPGARYFWPNNSEVSRDALIRSPAGYWS